MTMTHFKTKIYECHTTLIVYKTKIHQCMMTKNVSFLCLWEGVFISRK